MSDAESEEVSVVVERAGITVEKSFEPEDFPVPAIAFVIRSERDEPTEIRIADSVPDDVPAQDIGFHPKYGADFWNVEDDRIVFEREFETGEEYTTVYGLRAKDTDDIDRFLTEPAIEGLDETETVGDIIGEDTSEDDSAGESDDVDETEADSGVSLDLEDPIESSAEDDTAAGDEETPEPRAEASTADLEAAVAEAETTTTADEPDTDANGADGIDVTVGEVEEPTGAEGNGAETAAVESITPDDLAATLAAEIRAGEVDDEDLETLRDALGADLDEVEPSVPGSLEARMEKLQRDVTEVTAYTDALAAFLDEGGSAEELLAMRDDIEAMEDSVDSLEASLEAVEARVDSTETTAEAAAEDVAALESTVDGLSKNLSGVEAEVTGLREDVDALEDDLGEDLDDRVVELERQLEGMEDDIEDLEKLRQVFAGDD